MKYILLCFALCSTLGFQVSAFRYAIRVCFKDLTQTTVPPLECAYCDPMRLQSVMQTCTGSSDGIPYATDAGTTYTLTSSNKNCIIAACNEQYPRQRIFPTLFPRRTG